MKKKLVPVIVVSLVALLLVLVCCSTESAPVPTPHTYRVIYRVGGFASKASLTYETASGTEQRTVTLPWETAFDVKRGQFVYLSAQNETDRGSVTAEIIIDGSSWKTATSTSEYGIANVSGSVGED